MNELSFRQKQKLKSHDRVWIYVNSPKTKELHRGIATCIDEILGKYPKKKSRDTRVNMMAAQIREFDEHVPGMARKIRLDEWGFCVLCAIAALKHEGEFPCKEPGD